MNCYKIYPETSSIIYIYIMYIYIYIYTCYIDSYIPLPRWLLSFIVQFVEITKGRISVPVPNVQEVPGNTQGKACALSLVMFPRFPNKWWRLIRWFVWFPNYSSMNIYTKMVVIFHLWYVLFNLWPCYIYFLLNVDFQIMEERHPFRSFRRWKTLRPHMSRI